MNHPEVMTHGLAAISRVDRLLYLYLRYLMAELAYATTRYRLRCATFVCFLAKNTLGNYETLYFSLLPNYVPTFFKRN